jgi:hypothetical protein
MVEYPAPIVKYTASVNTSKFNRIVGEVIVPVPTDNFVDLRWLCDKSSLNLPDSIKIEKLLTNYEEYLSIEPEARKHAENETLCQKVLKSSRHRYFLFATIAKERGRMDSETAGESPSVYERDLLLETLDDANLTASLSVYTDPVEIELMVSTIYLACFVATYFPILAKPMIQSIRRYRNWSFESISGLELFYAKNISLLGEKFPEPY